MKKVNPKNRPATMRDVNRAKAEAFESAVDYSLIVMFTTLADKFGWNAGKLQRLYGEVNNLCEQISEGYAKLPELEKTLNDEYSVFFTRDKK